MTDSERSRESLLRQLQRAEDRLGELRAELERKETEHHILEQIDDGVIIVQDDARVRYANRALADTLDYSVDELLGMSIADLLAPEVRALVLDRYRRRMAGENVTSSYTTTLLTKKGQRVPVELNPTIDNYQGRPADTVVVRTLQRHRDAQQALLEERDLLAAIADTSPAGIVMLDRQGHISYANQRAAQILGLARRDTLQRTFDDAHWRICTYNGEPFPEEQLPFAQVMRSGEAVYDVQHAIQSADGRRRLLRINAAPIRDDEGEIASVAATVEDITREYRLANARMALNDSNQALIRARDETELMQGVCEALTQYAHYRLAWIGFLRPDEDNGIEKMAWAGEAQKDIRSLKVAWDDERLERDPGRAALHQGKTFVVDDLTQDPRFEAWHDQALAYGLRSRVTLPLFDLDERVFGILTLYDETPHAFGPEELGILQELAGDLAYGIQALRQRQELAETHRALEDSEERYRGLFTEMVSGCALHRMIYDASGQPTDYVIERVNPAFEHILRQSADAVEGLLASQAYDTSEPPFLDRYASVVAGKQPISFRGHYPPLNRHYAISAFPLGNERFATTFYDVTEEVRAERGLRQRVAQLEALSEAAAAINSALDLNVVLARIIEAATEVTGAEYASVLLRDEDGEWQERARTAGDLPPLENRVRPDGVTQWILETGHIVLIDDIDADGVLHPSLGPGGPRKGNPSLVGLGVRSMVGIPLRSEGQRPAEGRILGVLYVRGKQPALFRGQETLLNTLAHQAATAINQAQLYEDLRRNQQRLELALEGGRLAWWDWNVVKEHTDYDEHYAAMLGYDPAEFAEYLNNWSTMLVHPDDIDAVQEILDGHLAGETDRYETQYRTRTKDGDWRWVLDRGQAVERDAQGNALRVAGTVLDVTQQVEAQQALARSEERLRLVVQTADMAWWAYDGRPHQVLSNDRYAAMLGYDPDEFTPTLETWKALVHPDDRPRVFPLVDARQRGELDYTEMRYRLPTADGDWRWVFDQARVFERDEESRPLRVFGAILDVTEQIEAQQAIEESERRFRTAVEWAPFPIMIHAEGGEVLSISRAWTEITGYTLDDISTIDEWAERAYGKGKAEVRASIETLYDRDGAVDEGEFTIRCADGSQRIWAFSSAALGRLPDGRGVAMSIAADVTERHELMQALQEAERRREMALDGAALGTWEWNIATDEHWVDRRWAGILGYRPDELSSHLETWEKLVHPEDIAQQRAAWQSHVSGQEDRYEAQYRMRTKDGAWRWILARGRIVERDKEGNPIRAAGTHLDITERVEAQERIRRDQARLQSILDINQYEADDVQDLLDYALHQAVELTDSDVGYIYHYDEDTECFTLNSWSRHVMEQCEIINPRTVYELEKTGIWGEAVRQRRPIVVNDFQAPNPLRKGYPEGHVELHNFMTVPVFQEGSIVAVLGLGNRPSDYDEGDVLQVSLLADSIWQIAARFEMRQELAASEERFRGFINSSSDFVFLKDPDGRHVLVNEAYAEFLERDRQDIIGKTDADLLPPDLAAQCRQSDQAVLTEHRSTTIRERMGDKHYETHKFPVRMQDGRIGVGAIISDITNRVMAQRNLEESQERLNSALEAAQLGTWVLDIENEDYRIDERWTRILGYEPKEIDSVWDLWHDSIHPDDLEEQRQAWLPHYYGETDHYEATYRLRDKAGNWRWISSRGRAIERDEEGKALRAAGTYLDITNRVEAQRRLRESEERLALALEGADLGTWDWDLVRGEHRVNERWAEMLGYEHAEIVPRIDAFLQLVHRQDRRRVARLLKEHIHGESDVYQVEFRIKHKSGEWLWILSRGRVVSRDEDGRATRVAGTHLDVTERVRAEHDLQRERDFAQALEQAAAALGSSLDMEQVLDRILEQAARVVPGDAVNIMLLEDGSLRPTRWRGYERFGNTHQMRNTIFPLEDDFAYVVNQKDSLVVPDVSKHPNWVPRPGQEWLRAYMAVPIVIDSEAVGILNVDGTHVDQFDQEDAVRLQALASHASAALQNARLYEQAQREIAEREQAERALRQSEREYRTLFNSMGDAIFVHGPNGYFVEVNDEACRRLGYTREELMEMGPGDIDRGDYSGDVLSERVQTIMEQGQKTFETVHVAADGTEIPVEIDSRLIQREDQRYILSVSRDIRERLEMQEQLHRSQRLQQVGQLTSQIAHNFNNYLTAINGNAELALLDVDETAPLYNDLLSILRAGRQSAELVRNLLAFGRRQPMSPRAISLNDIMLEADQLLRGIIRSDIELVSLPEKGLWSVQADPALIEQVLVNMAINASHAIEEKGISHGVIELRTANVEIDADHAARYEDTEPGQYVRLTVLDNGTGMSDKVKSHLFEPFFTTKEQGRGTGLGLASAYGIIRQHGGHITIDTELGQGSSFHIYLPRNERREQPEFGGHRGLADLPGGSETILVAEDESSVRGFLERILRSLGYDVLLASNGEEARQILSTRAGDVDLLLTDLVMPRVSGRELAGHYLADHPDGKVLVVSGYSDEVEQILDALGSQIAYLPKPFRPGELASSLRQLLDS